MDKHKQNAKKHDPPAGRALTAISPEGIITVAFEGFITGLVVEGLLAELKKLIVRQRQSDRPVYILIDISGIRGHTTEARSAVKQASGLDFDRGAAYGGTAAQGLIMQYLQRSISAGRTRYFRDRSRALKWLAGDRIRTRSPLSAAPFMPIVMAVTCIAVAIWSYNSWVASRAEVTSESQAAFHQETLAAQAGFQKRFQVYADALYGFRGLYNASAEVDRNEFRAYFQNLNLQSDYPGFGSISYIQHVTAAQKNAYVAKVRGDTTLNGKGYPAFQIFPTTVKSDYYVLTYSEPSGDGSLGFDLSSDPDRAQALQAARDDGAYAASGTLALLGSAEKGFLITLPIYHGGTPTTIAQRQATLTGFVNAVFRYHIFFADALPADQKSITLTAHDARGAIVYDAGRLKNTPGLQRETRTLNVGGQVLKLDFAATPDYGLTATTKNLPLTIGLSGAVVSFLLLGVLLMQLRSRSRAIALANLMTEDLEHERNRAIANQQKLESAEKELKAEKAGVERKVALRTRQLSEAQAQLMASISGLPFGFALIDRESRILFANHELPRLIGRAIPDNPIAAGHVLEQISAEYHDAIDLLGAIKQAQSTLKPIEKTVEIGPRFFRFYVAAITLTDKASAKAKSVQAIGAILIMADVTEEKALQRSRDEFFSIASHELRTPLTAIMGNTSMMLDFYAEQLKDPTLHQMVADAQDASQRLIKIVNDFLDVSRLEQGEATFENRPTDLAPVVEQAMREIQALAEQHELLLTFDPPATPAMVLAGVDHTHQIISNLLSNAVKFTTKGSVTVSLSRTSSRVQLTVTDTGKGIPLEYQHLLFHKFQQATASILTRDDTRGTGLGLYIARLLARGMKGDVELTSSRSGKGSSFTLTLPAAPKPPSK